MELQNLKNRIRRHSQAAYALLPETLVPFVPSFKREHIEQKAQAQDWGQVVALIHALSKKNDFSPELRHELSLALEAMQIRSSIIAREMMNRVSPADKQVIGECIRALAYGPFIKHDGELKSVTGLQREQWVQVAEAWPNVENNLAACAAGAALGNILYYPHHNEDDWSKYISAPKARVEEVDENWHRLRKQITNS